MAWRDWRGWTGVGERRWKVAEGEQVRPAKTVWDVLQLLIVPVILVGVSLAWSASQDSRDKRRADQERLDATLNDYIMQMSDLMLTKGLLSSQPSQGARSLARVVTLTTLHRLDGKRNGELLLFLKEAGLLSAPNGRSRSVSLLRDADLRNVDFEGDDLSGANLVRANLTSADLSDADLGVANVSGANFENADLSDAYLGDANLSEAYVEHADLRHADLSNAYLVSTDFRHADLRDADLRYADLSNADLTDARLGGADLGHATLEGAIGIPKETS